MTVGQQWRAERDRAILCLRALGWTLRRIAGVFDLPASRISAIVAAESERVADDRPGEPQRGYVLPARRIVKKHVLEDD